MNDQQRCSAPMSSQARAHHLPAQLVASVIMLLGAPLCAAHIISHQQAAPNKQPKVIVPERGATIVQIARPNNQGVSHNQYQQFDVHSEGVILSNNATNALTQLHRTIAANPALANGHAANVIINEVVSTQPSRLNGPIEVAGKQAAIVISNPNGISVNGLRTINVNRTTLTTGKPVFGGSGSLEQLRVTGGQITFDGAGLKDLCATQTDIIARNIKVNARVWAEQLNVMTGNNDVNYNNLALTAIDGRETHPVVALDIAELGGMYANKIHLVGTEAGVGVKDYGEAALFAEDFHVHTTGEVEATLERPPRDKRNTDTPPGEDEDPVSEDVSLSDVGLSDVGLSNASLSSLDSSILASLHENLSTSQTLPELSENDIRTQMNSSKRRTIDVTPLPLVGGPAAVIPSPLPGQALGVTPSTSGAPYIGLTRFPDAQQPQPGPSRQMRPPVIPAANWHVYVPFNESQHDQWFVVPGKQDTTPIGLIPIFNPYSNIAGFYIPPAIHVDQTIRPDAAQSAPMQSLNTIRSTLATPLHRVQHDYRYWDAANYISVFHHSPSIRQYLAFFGPVNQANEMRIRETLLLMNLAQHDVDQARRHVGAATGHGFLTTSSNFHDLILQTEYDTEQQRITNMMFLPGSSASTSTTTSPLDTNKEL